MQDAPAHPSTRMQGSGPPTRQEIAASESSGPSGTCILPPVSGWAVGYTLPLGLICENGTEKELHLAWPGDHPGRAPETSVVGA